MFYLKEITYLAFFGIIFSNNALSGVFVEDIREKLRNYNSSPISVAQNSDNKISLEYQSNLNGKKETDGTFSHPKKENQNFISSNLDYYFKNGVSTQFRYDYYKQNSEWGSYKDGGKFEDNNYYLSGVIAKELSNNFILGAKSIYLKGKEIKSNHVNDLNYFNGYYHYQSKSAKNYSFTQNQVSAALKNNNSIWGLGAKVSKYKETFTSSDLSSIKSSYQKDQNDQNDQNDLYVGFGFFNKSKSTEFIYEHELSNNTRYLKNHMRKYNLDSIGIFESIELHNNLAYTTFKRSNSIINFYQSIQYLTTNQAYFGPYFGLEKKESFKSSHYYGITLGKNNIKNFNTRLSLERFKNMKGVVTDSFNLGFSYNI